jgi:hypothetical protein
MNKEELFVYDKDGNRIGKIVPIEEDLLTRKDVMRLLNVSYPTVVRMDQKGIIHRVNPPGTRTALYRRTDVEKLLKGERSNEKK